MKGKQCWLLNKMSSTNYFYLHCFRSNFISTSWGIMAKMNNILAESTADDSSFTGVIERIVFHFGNHIKMKNVCDEEAQQKILDETRFYLTNGICQLRSKATTVCINPTMLDPISRRWHVHYTLCPFDGYVPLKKEELDTSAEDGILIKSCQKILKNLVSSYRNRIDAVKIFFHLEDALEFCYAGTNDKFDIIDCSNLADHVGLVNVITAASRRLSDAPGSVLLTETMTWKSLAPSVAQYLEEALCAPLNMIPTIYGLRVRNHVELGSPVPVNIKRSSVPPANLCWEKAPFFRNISLHSSTTLTSCFQALARKCFVVNPRDTNAGKSTDRCAMLCYTPLTFDYVVSSLNLRVGGDQWSNGALDKLTFESAFHLSRKTMEAWKNGKKILKLSTEIQFDTTVASLSSLPLNFMKKTAVVSGSIIGMPALRLVLFPLSTAGPMNSLEIIQRGISGQGVHYIDNLQLELKRSANGEIETAALSFLLAADYGKEGILYGYVFDLLSGRPIFYIPTLTSLHSEEFHLPHPFDCTRPQLPLAPSQMAVDSCDESECQYTLKISIGGDQNVSGKFLNNKIEFDHFLQFVSQFLYTQVLK